ncbi:MAG: prephenate dehydrogenase/arogenate dehydrogenase family protein [Bacteroidaceae bacterium]|nr:prephenate dehydrogenase/arogenate dehydrogenase family protein [Bacteroidaceae bacterium]
MRILILGAGKMGAFFTDLLSFDHEVAVYDNDPKRLRFLYNTRRFISLDEVDEFNPEFVINAVSLKFTLQVFEELLPHIGNDCVLSDISSVKTGFKEYYESTGHRYVSSHPMFGPTFANLGQLSNENAILINEGDYMGRIFFRDLYSRLGLNLKELSFAEHDETMSYSLSIPFVSTFVFSAVMKHQDTPGTTFKRHMKIARGVLSEDDTLLREILFNPHTKPKVENIRTELKELIKIIDERNEEAMTAYLSKIRKNIE